MCLRANLMLLLLCAALPAQVTEKPLNNTAIVNMLKGGLPESTVVLAIQRAIARENTDFDRSTQALIELKNAGATEPILNFVLTAPTVERYEPSTIVPGLPVPKGLYFQSTRGWTALDPVVLFPDVEARSKTNWKVLGSWDRARESRLYAVPGRQARIHLAGPRPALYLRTRHPQSGWEVIRLTPQADHRELTATIPDVFAATPRLKFSSGAPIELDTSAAADDVVTLRPMADLPPGEYLIFRFASDQPWLIEGYTFEVEST